MDSVVKRSVLSYVNLFVTLILIVLAAVLLYRSFRYIRGFVRRGTTVQRVKKLCRERGYSVKILRNPHLSVLFPTYEPEMEITTPDKTLHVKFIAFPHPARTYLLNGSDRIFVEEKFPLNLLDRHKTLPPGLDGRVNRILRRRVIVGTEADMGLRELTKPGRRVSFPKRNEKNENILCVSPVSQEMKRVEGSRTVLLFDGDDLGNCAVYSGKGLLKYLET